MKKKKEKKNKEKSDVGTNEICRHKDAKNDGLHNFQEKEREMGEGIK